MARGAAGPSGAAGGSSGGGGGGSKSSGGGAYSGSAGSGGNVGGGSGTSGAGSVNAQLAQAAQQKARDDAAKAAANQAAFLASVNAIGKGNSNAGKAPAYDPNKDYITMQQNAARDELQKLVASGQAAQAAAQAEQARLLQALQSNVGQIQATPEAQAIARQRGQALGSQAFSGQQQQQLMQQLSAQATGQAPSLANAQLKAAQERNLAQQLAVAGAARGGNVAATQRQLFRQQAASGAETAQASAAMRIQEQISAQQQLGQLTQADQALQANIINQGIQSGLSLAQAQQQAALAVYQSQVQQEQFTKQQSTQIESARLSGQFNVAASEAGAKGQSIWNILGFKDGGVVGVEADKKKAMQAIFKQRYEEGTPSVGMEDKKATAIAPIKEIGQIESEEKKLEDKKASSAMDEAMAKVSSLPGIGGMPAVQSAMDKYQKAQALYKVGSWIAAAASDKDVKKDIKPGDEDVKNMLSSLKAFSYEYKNPKAPLRSEGEQTSVMAQDLEKSKLGKQMVGKMEDGTKYVDYGKGFGAILAAAAHLNQRLEALEKKGKK